MAAVGVGLKAGLTLIPDQKGAGGNRLTSMRLEIIEKNGLTVINESYNANPA